MIYVGLSVGCVSALVGFFLIIYLGLYLRSLVRSRRLVEIEGEVDKSKISKRLKIIGPAVIEMFRNDVCYNYQYGGVGYESSVYGLLDSRRWDSNKSEVEKNMLMLGAKVPVYVDPRWPRISYLDPNIKKTHVDFLLTYFIVSIILISVGFGVIFLQLL